jgi:hypothetical protein
VIRVSALYRDAAVLGHVPAVLRRIGAHVCCRLVSARATGERSDTSEMHGGHKDLTSNLVDTGSSCNRRSEGLELAASNPEQPGNGAQTCERLCYTTAEDTMKALGTAALDAVLLTATPSPSRADNRIGNGSVRLP